MRIESLHVGMMVRHPQYGVGRVKALNERAADVQFEEGLRTIDPEASGLRPAEPAVAVSGLEQPLREFIEQTVTNVLDRLNIERPAESAQGLAPRWHGGRMVLHPRDATLQTKEIPLEVFFHKIVMMRNNLRVLEQKINGHDRLSEGEKVELQHYITRCYGSMTTFNLLFRDKADQFSGGSSDA